MHLSELLSASGAKAAFCRSTDLSPAYVSDICSGKAWPNRRVWRRIVAATGGQVTPNDHLHDPPTKEPENGKAPDR